MWRKDNGKAQALPEKSNFSRRCSLLSRYLKEKGSFGNIDLGLVPKSESGNQIVMQKADPTEIKALGLFQKVSKGEPSTSSGGKVKDENLRSEPGSSQLTIFFGGQILVYNEFPADKAKEIMEVAKQAMPVTLTQINVENNNLVLPDLNEPTNSEEINQRQQEQNQIVERIARRASLHRFFAKRKDRAVARAPYQVNQNAGNDHHYPPKPETRTSQPLELGQSSQRPQSPHNAVAHTVAHPEPEGDKHLSMDIENEGRSSKDLELRL